MVSAALALRDTVARAGAVVQGTAMQLEEPVAQAALLAVEVAEADRARIRRGAQVVSAARA